MKSFKRDVRPPFLEIDLFFRKVRQVTRHSKISRIFHCRGWHGSVVAELPQRTKSKRKVKEQGIMEIFAFLTVVYLKEHR